eukprot:scaffold8236_cov123-Isochrysis_galbana.AAC.2
MIPVLQVAKLLHPCATRAASVRYKSGARGEAGMPRCHAETAAHLLPNPRVDRGPDDLPIGQLLPDGARSLQCTLKWADEHMDWRAANEGPHPPASLLRLLCAQIRYLDQIVRQASPQAVCEPTPQQSPHRAADRQLDRQQPQLRLPVHVLELPSLGAGAILVRRPSATATTPRTPLNRPSCSDAPFYPGVTETSSKKRIQ